MTQSPTPAEVQAAYDELIGWTSDPEIEPYSPLRTLLAAVERDTLGWREVDRDTFITHGTPCKAIRADDGIGLHYFIKDAAP